MKTWRTFILIAIMMAAVLMPALAADEGLSDWGNVAPSGTSSSSATGAEVENPFSIGFRFLQAVLFSAAAGALVGARFMINMVKAYYSRDSQEGAYKREIIKFLITVAIVMFAGVTLSFVTGWI